MNSNITKGDEVKENVNPFKVGDILLGTKGWDCIIPVFYEVVRCTKKQVVVKELTTRISSGGEWEWGWQIPCPGEYQSEETFRGKVDRFDVDGEYYAHVDRIRATLWDGKPAYFDYT